MPLTHGHLIEWSHVFGVVLRSSKAPDLNPSMISRVENRSPLEKWAFDKPDLRRPSPGGDLFSQYYELNMWRPSCGDEHLSAFVAYFFSRLNIAGHTSVSPMLGAYHFLLLRSLL